MIEAAKMFDKASRKREARLERARELDSLYARYSLERVPAHGRGMTSAY